MTVNGRGVGDLIYLYTEKQDSDEWILKNDLFSAEECGGNVLSLLFELDGIRLYMNHPVVLYSEYIFD